MRRAGVATLALALAVGGCWGTDQFYKEFAWCSDAGTCPPNQECTPWGVCMRPCPVGCTGSGCDCSNPMYGGSIYTCADGYCQTTCTSSGGSCPGAQTCSQSAHLCRNFCIVGPSGQFPGECPNSLATCVAGVTSNRGYCEPVATADGGVD